MEVIEKERVTVVMPSKLASRVRRACTRDLLIPDIHEQAVQLWFSDLDRRNRSWFQRLMLCVRD